MRQRCSDLPDVMWRARTGNLLFAGRKTGQEEEEFFSHALCTHTTEKVAMSLSPVLCVSYHSTSDHTNAHCSLSALARINAPYWNDCVHRAVLCWYRRSAFKKFSAWPTHTGLSDFAKWDATGEEVPRDCHDFPWCLVLQPLLRPDGSGPAAVAGKRRLELEVEAKVQGSGFKRMWAVLCEGNATLCTYVSQADAATGTVQTVLPKVELQTATRVEPLPQKYEGQDVIGLQPQKQMGEQKELPPPLFFRFATAEDCKRWSAAIARVSSGASVASGGGKDAKLSSASTAAQNRSATYTDKTDGGAPGFLQQLSYIPAGTALYEVFACPSPECATRMTRAHDQVSHHDPATAALQEAGGETPEQPFLLKVGVMRSVSRFVRSSHRLAFRHQRKEEDYARKPHWIDELDRGGGLHLNVGHKAFEENIRAGRYAECS